MASPRSCGGSWLRRGRLRELEQVQCFKIEGEHDGPGPRRGSGPYRRAQERKQGSLLRPVRRAKKAGRIRGEDEVGPSLGTENAVDGSRTRRTKRRIHIHLGVRFHLDGFVSGAVKKDPVRDADGVSLSRESYFEFSVGNLVFHSPMPPTSSWTWYPFSARMRAAFVDAAQVMFQQ